MRELSKQEVTAVAGGLETITVTGTRGGGENSVYPSAWESLGMSPQEYIFGNGWDVVGGGIDTFTIGGGAPSDGDPNTPDNPDETDFVGPTIDVDTNGDGEADTTIQFGIEYDGFEPREGFGVSITHRF